MVKRKSEYELEAFPVQTAKEAREMNLDYRLLVFKHPELVSILVQERSTYAHDGETRVNYVPSEQLYFSARRKNKKGEVIPMVYYRNKTGKRKRQHWNTSKLYAMNNAYATLNNRLLNMLSRADKNRHTNMEDTEVFRLIMNEIARVFKQPEGSIRSMRDVTCKILYPAFKDSSPPALLPGGFSQFAKIEDAKERALALFGKKRYRRALPNLIQIESIPILYTSWEFRNLVPMDWILEGLRAEPSTRQVRVHEIAMLSAVLRERRSNIHDLFSVLSPTIKRRLYLDIIRNYSTDENREDREFLPNAISDVVRLIKQDDDGTTRLGVLPGQQVRGVRTWRELHDRVVGEERRRIRAERDRMRQEENTARQENMALLEKDFDNTVFPRPELHERLTSKGLRIEIPNNHDTLVEWGDLMHNCIGSSTHYAISAHKRQVHLLGVFDQDTLIATIELRVRNDQPMRIMQLYGKYNRLLNEEQSQDITETLCEVIPDLKS